MDRTPQSTAELIEMYRDYLDNMYYDHIASIVDHRRPGNYRRLEEVCPGYVAKRLPTAFVHYIRNAINAPLDLLSFLLEAMRVQFTHRDG